MKDIATHTRIPPQGRCQTLEDFIHQINQNTEVQKEVAGWNLGFSSGLLEIAARTIKAEMIYMGRDISVSKKIPMIIYLMSSIWHISHRQKHFIGIKWKIVLIHLFKPLFIYLFIYCHLYSALSIVQCSNALYRLWDGEIQGHTGQPSVREIDAHTMYNSMSNRSWPKPQLS